MARNLNRSRDGKRSAQMKAKRAVALDRAELRETKVKPTPPTAEEIAEAKAAGKFRKVPS